MGYSLHIERTDSEISVQEWLAAASEIESLRPRTAEYLAVNPASRTEIRISNSGGDLEIKRRLKRCIGLFGKTEEWEPAFYFSSGRGSFPAPAEIDNADDPMRAAAATLAKRLGAKIVGDEGEEYLW
jgi:hypothetical protein